MSDTPVQEQRDRLMATASDLTQALRDAARVANTLVNELIGNADSLLMPAADEKDNQGRPKVTPIRHNAKPTEGTPTPEPQSIEKIKLPPGKRGCGSCGQPGHRRQSCPNAHVVRAADVAKKAQPKKKRRKK